MASEDYNIVYCNFGAWQNMITGNCHSMEDKESLKLSFCITMKRTEFGIGTTRGWINYDRIFIFGWIILLGCHLLSHQYIKYYAPEIWAPA